MRGLKRRVEIVSSPGKIWTVRISQFGPRSSGKGSGPKPGLIGPAGSAHVQTE
jgi:hypothetical protein